METGSIKFMLSKIERKKIMKSVFWTAMYALLVSASVSLSDIELPQEFVWLTPIIAGLLKDLAYASKKYITDTRVIPDNLPQ